MQQDILKNGEEVLKKIINLSKEAGNPTPRFEETGMDVNVYLPLRASIVSGIETKQIIGPKISDREEEILNIIKENNFINVQKISENLKSPVSQRTIHGDLAKLEKRGLIERQGKGRATIWCVVL